MARHGRKWENIFVPRLFLAFFLFLHGSQASFLPSPEPNNKSPTEHFTILVLQNFFDQCDVSVKHQTRRNFGRVIRAQPADARAGAAGL